MRGQTLHQQNGLSLEVGKLYQLMEKYNIWNTEDYSVPAGSFLLVVGVGESTKRSRNYYEDGRVLLLLTPTGKLLEWYMLPRKEGRWSSFPKLEEV